MDACGLCRSAIPVLLALALAGPATVAFAAGAAKGKPGGTAFAMPKIRLVAISTPVAVAAIRAAGKPVKVGTVSYVIGATHTAYDVLVAGAGDGGLTWSAVQPGLRQRREGLHHRRPALPMRPGRQQGD